MKTRLRMMLLSGAALAAAAPALHVSHPPQFGGIVGFLLSPQGRVVLQSSNHPLAQALRERLGANPAPPPSIEEVSLPPDAPAQDPCGSAAGTRFNLEPRTPPAALPQNGTVVDFLAGAGAAGDDIVVGAASDFRGTFGGLANSGTGYYVHRGGGAASACGADFEGGLPPLLDSGRILPGGGDPDTEADPARSAFFIADVRLTPSVSAIGLFRTTAPALLNATACPAGTHSLAASQTCWPVGVEILPSQVGGLLVAPHLAVDPRASGAGAGDVYVSAVLSDLTGIHAVIAACRNNLSVCSPAVPVSGSDISVLSPYIRVRPDVQTHPGGAVTLTYVNTRDSGPPDFLPIFDVRYVNCTPQGAPNPPSCTAPIPVATESQPVGGKAGLGGGSLAAAQFLISTSPKHEHRVDANGVETYIVWDRCQVPVPAGTGVCPDSSIVMAASADRGATWKFAAVDNGRGDQYFPALSTDSTNTINIAYYSSRADSSAHRAQVMLRQIPPGAATPDPVSDPLTLTALGMDPSGDFFLGGTFIGSNIGVAARSTAGGRRAYVHFMHNAVPGTYNGAPSPEQNNHLTRFDY